MISGTNVLTHFFSFSCGRLNSFMVLLHRWKNGPFCFIYYLSHPWEFFRFYHVTREQGVTNHGKYSLIVLTTTYVAPAKRNHGHSEPGVAPQQRFVPCKEIPVEIGEGTVAFGIEGAPIAVVAHPEDVGCTGYVGLRGHQFSHRKGSHAQHVGFDHPVVGIGICYPEPIGQLTGETPIRVARLQRTMSRVMW